MIEAKATKTFSESAAKHGYATAPVKSTGMPPGIPYIIGNEAAERFSYYGMKAILVVFMTKYMMTSGGQMDRLPDAQAKEYFHYFVSAVYFLPLLGGILADTLLGKYRTIILLSLVYCAGHIALALDATRAGLFLGLTLISFGAGGIKPCVSAHVGDQFGASNSHLIPRVFSWFYFSINSGSAISTLLIPVLLDKYGPHVAFGIPGILMIIATLVFWMGRKKFVHIPPGGSQFFKDNLRVIIWAVVPFYFSICNLIIEALHKKFGHTAGVTTSIVFALLAMLLLWSGRKDLFRAVWLLIPNFLMLLMALIEKSSVAIAISVFGICAVLMTALGWYGCKKSQSRSSADNDHVESLKIINRLFGLYIFVAAFWALFDQTSSAWVLQAEKMDRHAFGRDWLSSQLQAINPILVVILIPIFSYAIYPAINKVFPLTPLRKIAIGFFVAVPSFIIPAWLEIEIAKGAHPNIIWQFVAYCFITAAEVLISITSLEFSYTQAPKKLKSLIMAVFLSSVTLGNLFTAGFNAFIQNPDGSTKTVWAGANYYYFFAGLMLVTAIVFVFVAGKFKVQTFIQDEAPNPA